MLSNIIILYSVNVKCNLCRGTTLLRSQIAYSMNRNRRFRIFRKINFQISVLFSMVKYKVFEEMLNVCIPRCNKLIWQDIVLVVTGSRVFLTDCLTNCGKLDSQFCLKKGLLFSYENGAFNSDGHHQHTR